LFLVGAFYSTAAWPDVLLMFRKYDKFLFAVFFIPLFIEERWRNYAVNAFLAAIFVMFVASYLRVYGWLHYGAQAGVVEVFRNSIQFNFLMAFAAYLCLYKVAIGQRYRWLWITFLLFIVYTILFRSIGRSGYFVFAGLMGLFFFQKLRWRGLLAAIISMAILFSLAFAFSPTFKDRIKEVVSDVKVYRQNDNTSVGLRMSFVKNSVKLIKAHPVFGTGTGSFVHEYAVTNHSPVHNPHNEYVYLTVQFGALGLVMLLLLFGIPFWYSRFLPEECKYIARGAVVGIMLGCLANSWLLDTTQGHFYAYFIALAFSAFPIKKQTIS
jgi:O-antigen ligase